MILVAFIWIRPLEFSTFLTVFARVKVHLHAPIDIVIEEDVYVALPIVAGFCLNSYMVMLPLPGGGAEPSVAIPK